MKDLCQPCLYNQANAGSSLNLQRQHSGWVESQIELFRRHRRGRHFQTTRGGEVQVGRIESTCFEPNILERGR